MSARAHGLAPLGVYPTAAVIIIEPECGRCHTGTNRERSVLTRMAPMSTPRSRFLSLALGACVANPSDRTRAASPAQIVEATVLAHLGINWTA
jgi:hypothetical protein